MLILWEPALRLRVSAKTAELSAALGSLQTHATGCANCPPTTIPLREEDARMSLVRSTTSWDRR